MVAKITFPRRVQDALQYNERKVRRGVAHCLAAVGYLGEAHELDERQKLGVLVRRNALNRRAATRTLHVSLNFHPSEQLSGETLLAVAARYLAGIGFAGQPYLVYQHLDSGHPHLHLVSTLIRGDGTRIPTHNLGRGASERTRREVERVFDLVPAEGRRPMAAPKSSDTPPPPLLYGQGETKSALARVVSHVFHHYCYTSLAHFNAALRSFNVVADRGREESRTYRSGGLVYHALNAAGKKAGVPVKASELPGSPTLKKLEERFVQNRGQAAALRQVVHAKLEACLSDGGYTLQQWCRALEGKGICTLLHSSAGERLYGITFVDREARCVLRGSEIGPARSAAALQERLTALSAGATDGPGKPGKGAGRTLPAGNPAAVTRGHLPARASAQTIPHALLAPEPPSDSPPAGLLPRKKRKKKKGPSR